MQYTIPLYDKIRLYKDHVPLKSSPMIQSSILHESEYIGSVSTFGEPFLNAVPGFGENFTIPFALGSKDEYLLWLFHFMGQLKTQYGENVARYVVEYINGDDLALHTLPADEEEKEKIFALASSVVYSTLGYGVCMVYNMKYCDTSMRPMNCLRKFHQEFCKYKLEDLEEWFGNWAYVLQTLRDEDQNEAYKFALELNGFTAEEVELMKEIQANNDEKRELIARYLENSGSDYIDLSKRAYDVNSKLGSPPLHKKAVDGSWFLSKPKRLALAP